MGDLVHGQLGGLEQPSRLEQVLRGEPAQRRRAVHFARDTGVSPTAYRRTYRGDPTRSVPGIKRRTPVTVGNESSSHQP